MQVEEINVFCRVCLKSCNGGSQIMITKEILKLFPIKIDLSINEESHMCGNCKERVEKCYTFKLACLNTENFIRSISSSEADKRWDIKEVYLNKNENKNTTDFPVDHSICRLCLSLVNNKFCTSLTDEGKSGIMLKLSIEKLFAEIDLNVTINPVVCNTCYGPLQEYFNFITDCTNTDEEYNNFCEIKSINSNNQVEFMSMNVINDDICDIIKKYCNDDGQLSEIKLDNLKVDPHALGIKCEQAHTEVNISSAQDYMQTSQLKTEDEQDWVAPCEVENYKFKICNNFSDSNLPLESNLQLYSNEQLHQCEGYANNELESLTDTSSSFYHCKMCPFKTQHKFSLKRHETRHKSTFDQNGMSQIVPSSQETNKDPLEVPIYSCDVCPYKSKYKFALTRHTILHKDDSQIKIYKCEVCPYESKYKNYLKQHQFIHQDSSEAVMYRCETCPYHTKRKDLLRQHMAVHMSNPDKALYYCATCTYKTPHKSYLSRHLLTHKDELDMPVYQCEVCPYKTKLKFRLKRHKIVHKDNSEVKSYSCKICKFETRYKSSLKFHELSHKDSAGAVLYHCEECSYRTKRKECLEQHVAVHTSKAIYNCEKCKFKTTYKDSLRRHLFTHKDESELKLYQCEVCPYKTKYSFGLKRHMMVHTDFSQATTYQCEMCEYKTKYKFSHKLHRLSHEEGSKTVTCQ